MSGDKILSHSAKISLSPGTSRKLILVCCRLGFACWIAGADPGVACKAHCPVLNGPRPQYHRTGKNNVWNEFK